MKETLHIYIDECPLFKINDGFAQFNKNESKNICNSHKKADKNITLLSAFSPELSFTILSKFMP